MSQFAPKADVKLDVKADVKADVKLDVKTAEKIVLLAEVDVSKDDLKELHKNATVCSFDADVQSDSNIVDLLGRFDCLIVDIRKPKDLKWYQLMRSAIEKDQNVNVVYLHQKGVPITTRDHIKEHLSADYIVKTLPKKEEYNGKNDYWFRLLSDHIPIKRNWFAVVKSVLSCVCSSEEDSEGN